MGKRKNKKRASRASGQLQLIVFYQKKKLQLPVDICKKIISVCRIYFDLIHELDDNLQLLDKTGHEIDNELQLSPNDGPFQLQVKHADEKRSPFQLRGHRLLDYFRAQTGTLYRNDVIVRSPDANDIRRAFSLCRWRAIYRKVALEQKHLFDDEDSLQTLLNELNVSVLDELEALDIDDSLGEALSGSDLFQLLDRRDSQNNEDDKDLYQYAMFWLRQNIPFFTFSSNSKVEFQFHLFWKDILQATIALPQLSPLKLYVEYQITRVVEGYKKVQFIDFVVFFEECKSPFAVLFVELAGSVIAPSDDHKDFQKLISASVIYLSDICVKLTNLNPPKTTSELSQLRVFGIFMTRFAFDLVVVRPIFDNEDVTSMAFVVETDRTKRCFIDHDKKISQGDDITQSSESLRESGRGGAEEELLDQAFHEDSNRPIQQDDEILGISEIETVSDMSELRNDQLQHRIYAALKGVDFADLKPLFKFGMMIRHYCEDVKDWFDEENLDGLSKIAMQIPEPASSRASASQATPAKVRPRSGQQSRRSTQSGASGRQASSRSGIHQALDSIKAYNIATVYDCEGALVISFESDQCDAVRVLKRNTRRSAKNEIEITRSLHDYRFVPFVYSSVWDEKNAHGTIIAEQLARVNPNSGLDILSRFADHLHFMHDLIESVQYLHSLRILHRDISPGNAMYSTRDGRYKLLDFESAVFLPDNQNVHVDEASIGTKQYVDPYVHKTHEYSFVSDWYSLGFVCFQRAVYDTSPEMDSYQSDSDLNTIYDRVCNVASSMMHFRKKPMLEPHKLLLEIASIRHQLQTVQDCRKNIPIGNVSKYQPSSDPSRSALCKQQMADLQPATKRPCAVGQWTLTSSSRSSDTTSVNFKQLSLFQCKPVL